MIPVTEAKKRSVSIAFVHHANQFLVTDGYENKQGISSILGNRESGTGYLRVFDLHRRYRIPFNLHLSGTLLEAIAWHSPEVLSELTDLLRLDLLEMVGSAYGQNIMRFFSREHNTRQLKEQLLLQEELLGLEPERVKVFWVPERLWDTEALAKVLTDNRLPNGGYEYVLLDDRLFYSKMGDHSPRRNYDQEHAWNPANFLMYRIKDGSGLRALPIAYNLRQNIPPRTPEGLETVKTQLRWLLDLGPNFGELVAIYADDLEKPAGAGWDRDGPAQYESILKWVSENPWLKAVKLGEWASPRSPGAEKRIETGTYFELANEFEAGEDYERWYYDARWDPYRKHYEWSENRVEELASRGSDPALIELARKVILASVWQTAWHTPKTGAHGNPDSVTGPSEWVRAIASHARVAALIAEAAYWMKHKDKEAHAYLQDLDQDGEEELVLKNSNLFSVFSPRNGGRLVYLFGIREPPGRLVVGNPIDDWNWLERLHEYMDVPPNHPGAFSDVGYEHDCYEASLRATDGDEVNARLLNAQPDSPRIEKKIRLFEGGDAIRVEYALPETMASLLIEFGLSPDYLSLLRDGRRGARSYSPMKDTRGWADGDLAVWVGLDESSAFENPRSPIFGHGWLVRVAGLGRRFELRLGVDLTN
ncbi:MAG: hypothetical protein AUJ07_08315 [Crenarchaeota archaeon 13_1_40CM_3_53_5]|nr:MAG: hypothetical protein AUJ07_08315 [Crenarchaeota archaeon 13_1_40CM_3_53_5]